MATRRKEVYVYELAADWRNRIGVGPAQPHPTDPLRAEDGLDGASWAALEFGVVPLGEARLADQRVTVVEIIGENPMASFPPAAKGDRSLMEDYYGFLDKPDCSAVTPESILQPNRERTLRRMLAEPVALRIQDGTVLNSATRQGCEGLGVIGSNQTRAETLGLNQHSTMAITPNGMPLGILAARFEVPPSKSDPAAPSGHKSTRKRTKITKKPALPAHTTKFVWDGKGKHRHYKSK